MKRLLFTLLFFSACCAWAMDTGWKPDPALLEAARSIDAFERFGGATAADMRFNDFIKRFEPASADKQEAPFEKPETAELVPWLARAVSLLGRIGPDRWIMPHAREDEAEVPPKGCKVKKYFHCFNRAENYSVATILFDLPELPSEDFLRLVSSLPADDGAFQMAVIRVQKGQTRSDTGNLKQAAQGMKLSFCGQHAYLEWRKLSPKAFQEKIQRSSPGAARRGAAGGAGRGNYPKR